MALIAIPMSQVNPRQGRFFKMAPAILLYLAYIGGLIATSSMVAAGKMNPIVGVWPVHVIFLAIGVGLVTWEPIQRGFRKRRLERMGLPEAISKDGGNEDS
jgi:lipopolysaccharide export system permease protein